MDLSIGNDQAAIQAMVDRFLLAEVPSAAVREAEPLGFSPGVWSRFTLLGLVGMATAGIGDPSPTCALPIGAADGDASLLDAALVCEALGRHLAPVPFVETVVAARTLLRAGSAIADKLVDEGEVGTVALAPADAGMAASVPAGAVAGVVVALDGDSLVAVVGPADDTHRLRALGATPIAHRCVRTTASASAATLACGGAARVAHRLAVMEWRILTASALVGLARGAFDLATSYVKQRHQFGAPLASFQALSHRLADGAIELEGAQLLAREAAWAVTSSPADAPRLADMSFAFASETAQRLAAESLHLHGGYGYMLEYDVQLFFTRAKAWTLVGGDPRALYPSIADDLIGGATKGPAWISH